ncbi:MAG: hypothetical protein ACYTGW_11330 [Planctomycetota bacterium]|jgi:hypothetical protein
MADADALLTFTVATVWREQRVSCPHPDILKGHEAGALGGGAAEFIHFHLQESQCPYCNAVLEDLRAQQRDAEQAELADMKDRLMRSTTAAIRRASGA